MSRQLATVAPARPLTLRHWLLALSLGATVGACLWVSQLSLIHI